MRLPDDVNSQAAEEHYFHLSCPIYSLRMTLRINRSRRMTQPSRHGYATSAIIEVPSFDTIRHSLLGGVRYPPETHALRIVRPILAWALGPYGLPRVRPKRGPLNAAAGELLLISNVQ